MARLPPLHPAVAETRVAVRHALAEFRGGTVLVALSGGADSLALAAALAFEAPKLQVQAGAVIVDHGLQAGSAQIADRAAAQATALGLHPVIVRRVQVEQRHSDGPEAAAREARYEALESARAEHDASAVFTAHTRDDQAEQVLLALARGSGTRAIAGIPPSRGALKRPFLDVSRETTLTACAAQGLEAWADPHNRDPQFTRVRVRERVLPLLEAELGGGIAANLARSAALAREDADALDALAEDAAHGMYMSASAGAQASVQATAQVPTLRVSELAALPPAIRNRVIRLVATREFALPPTREHTLLIAGLVTEWRGQGPIHVPGGKVDRDGDELHFRAN